MTEPQSPVRAYVARRGVQGFPWTVYCTDEACRRRGPSMHTDPQVGAMGVNTAVGNRTHRVAVLAALHHLAKSHGRMTS